MSRTIGILAGIGLGAGVAYLLESGGWRPGTSGRNLETKRERKARRWRERHETDEQPHKVPGRARDRQAEK